MDFNEIPTELFNDVSVSINTTVPPTVVCMDRAPTIFDGNPDYIVGSIWINTSNNREYILMEEGDSSGSSIWEEYNIAKYYEDTDPTIELEYLDCVLPCLIPVILQYVGVGAPPKNPVPKVDKPDNHQGYLEVNSNHQAHSIDMLNGMLNIDSKKAIFNTPLLDANVIHANSIHVKVAYAKKTIVPKITYVYGDYQMRETDSFVVVKKGRSPMWAAMTTLTLPMLKYNRGAIFKIMNATSNYINIKAFGRDKIMEEESPFAAKRRIPAYTNITFQATEIGWC